MRIIYVIKHELTITLCIRKADGKAKTVHTVSQILEAKWFKSSRSAKAYITKNNLHHFAKRMGGRLLVVGYEVSIYSKSGRCKFLESMEVK